MRYRYIENQMLNDTAWADRDADRVPMKEDEIPADADPLYEVGDIVTDSAGDWQIMSVSWDWWEHDWLYECEPLFESEIWYAEKIESEITQKGA